MSSSNPSLHHEKSRSRNETRSESYLEMNNIAIKSRTESKDVQTFSNMPPLLFVEKISPSIICPIHRGLLIEPLLVIICGHTFCRRCIEISILSNSSPHCPIDKKPMTIKDTVPNLAISEQVNELRIHCPNGCKIVNGELVTIPDGCQEVILFGQREAHEKLCLFAEVNCPNSSSCDLLLRRHLPAHLEVCKRTPCPNKIEGCTFEGQKKEIEKHLHQCHFKQTIRKDSDNSKMNSELITLRKTVEDLTDRMRALEEQLILSKQTIFTLAQEVERERSNTTIALNSFQELIKLNLGVPLPQLRKIARAVPKDGVSELQMPFSFNCSGTFVTTPEQVWCLYYTNNLLMSGGSKGMIKVWDLNARRCVHSIKAHEGTIHALVGGGGLLYSAGEDSMLTAWNLQNFQEHQTIKVGDNPVSSMVLTDRFLITGSLATIKVWNCLNFKCEHVLNGLVHWVWVRALALDEKKTKLYSGTHNAIQVWDTSTFQCLMTINTSFGSIYSIVLTPRFLICGTYNQNIHLYELTNRGTFDHFQTLTGHIGTVRALAVSVTGRYLFSGSMDRTVMIWNLENFLCTQTLFRQEEGVNSIVYKNGVLFCGSLDQTIAIYEAQ